ncbi:hypothetical protein FSP39_019576 [Pinctada imbricata]|uniref:Protein kinase domain-containing protein n=1 Tax=Pinctada imbricata TaxID=66713 RepID=A0AA89BZJ5_PINIB|nr:hypothetical protein FSP39_019576 [Pinctada imbricata]
MSSEPKPKRRKMEPHIGGDNCQVQAHSTKSVQSVPSGSASGDFGSDEQHQYVTAISGDDGGTENAKNYRIYKQGCELGDEWEQTYPAPLSSFPKRTIKTGNSYYDTFVSELESVGYRPLQVIAKGRSGTVLVAQDLSKEAHFGESEYIPVALKLNTAKSRRKSRMSWKTDMTEEMRILRQLNHPSIISWIMNISHDGRSGIVLEFCENGDLEHLLRLHEARFLTEPVCKKYFEQIFKGVEYIHNQNIAHRDLCTRNILISQKNTLKIADFGHALYYYTGDPLRKDECGTVGFQAPEIVAGALYNPKICDIWSLGSILYLMATGKHPLGIIHNEILTRASKELHFPDQKILPLSSEMRELARGLLSFLPDTRFTLNRIKCCAWLRIQEGKVQIGNFHLIRQPKKIREGDREIELKQRYQI